MVRSNGPTVFAEFLARLDAFAAMRTAMPPSAHPAAHLAGIVRFVGRAARQPASSWALSGLDRRNGHHRQFERNSRCPVLATAFLAASAANVDAVSAGFAAGRAAQPMSIGASPAPLDRHHGRYQQFRGTMAS